MFLTIYLKFKLQLLHNNKNKKDKKKNPWETREYEVIRKEKMIPFLDEKT